MTDSRAVSGSNPLWRTLRVLVVDDEVMMLRTIRRMLKRARPDWKLVTVTSGEFALEQLEHRPFDVIVTDLRMNGMQGRTLLELVRVRYPDVVRVIHSGHVDTLPPQSKVSLAQALVAKPANGETLIRAIERAVGFDEEDETSSAC